MCTAINDVAGRHLFGRTLDLEYSLNESVVITPRNFTLKFRHESPQERHLAMLGIAHIANGTPLYYDAVNEAGLCAAALNFGGSATYFSPRKSGTNIASFELIPYILGQCKSIGEAAEILKSTTVTDENFDADLPSTTLHWMIADKTGAITVEQTRDGMKIYENPFGVMTNEPPFDYHLTNIKNYMSLTSLPPQNEIYPSVNLAPYSRGMGALGLPGDFSSASRFVRAVFLKGHTAIEEEPSAATNRFFHIMSNLSVPKACVITPEGKAVSTVYTSCADTESMTYYFTTYNNRNVRSVRLAYADVDSDRITAVKMG